MSQIKTPQTVWVEVQVSERLPERETNPDFKDGISVTVIGIQVNDLPVNCFYNFKKNKWFSISGFDKVNIVSWLEKHLLPCAAKSAEEVITDEEIIKVWQHANFGDISKRQVILDTLKKFSQGWSTGHTAKCIVSELGLIWNKNGHDALSDKGLEYFIAAMSSYASQAVNGGYSKEDMILALKSGLNLADHATYTEITDADINDFFATLPDVSASSAKVEDAGRDDVDGWIKIEGKETLPPDLEEVLTVHIEAGGIEKAFYSYEDERWISCDSETEKHGQILVTHWQPLPPPPLSQLGEQG